jgi:hypothetical protein
MKPALIILAVLNAFLFVFSGWVSYQFLVSERQNAFLLGAGGIGMQEYLNVFNAQKKGERRR